MANYKRIILAEDDTGRPVLAVCPTAVCVEEGDLVSVSNGTLVVAQKSEYIDTESTKYDIFSAITVIYEAEAVYHLRWEKEQENGES